MNKTTHQVRKVFGVCGERSGDHILKRILKPRVHDYKSSYVGIEPVETVWTPTVDPSLKNVPVLFDGPKDLGVMGMGLDLLKSLPKAHLRLHQTEARIKALNPDVLLTVDAKGFCLRLQQRLASIRTIKRVHVCAPSIWGYKNGLQRARNLVSLDALGTVLPFEPFYWQVAGWNDRVNFVGYFAVETLLDALGHPDEDLDDEVDPQWVPAINSQAVQSIPLPHEIPYQRNSGKLPRLSKTCRSVIKREFIKQSLGNQMLEDDPLLVLAPGSRVNVVRSAIPVMQSVIRELGRRGRLHYGICILSSEEDPILSMLKGVAANLKIEHPHLPIAVINDKQKIEALASASAAFAVSGTIVTELHLFQVPTVVMYNAGGFATEYMARRIAAVHSVSLCNILSGKSLCPEFLFEQCKDIRKLADQVERILFDKDAAQHMIEQISPLLDRLVLWKDGKPLRPSSVARQMLKAC